MTTQPTSAQNRQAHAGTVKPRESGNFTWECICGAKPDPVTSWGSFDGAALALQRHIERQRRKGEAE